MGVPPDLQVRIDSIIDHSSAPTLANEFNGLTLPDKDIQAFYTKYLTFLDSYIISFLAAHDFNDEAAVTARKILTESYSLFDESFNPVNFLSFTIYTDFIHYCQMQHHIVVDILKTAKANMDNSEGFQTINSRKRKTVDNSNDILLSNRYEILKDSVNPDDNVVDMTENPLPPNETNLNTSEEKKNRIHPFLIEIRENWQSLTEAIKLIIKDRNIIKLDGEHLKVQCTTDTDFRAVQNYLANNSIAFTTLSPYEIRPRKFCVRGIPTYTNPQTIINAFKDLGVTVNRAAMLKNRKTGNFMPIYLINVIPDSNFDAEKIYNITELCHLNIKIERFKGANIVKQCHNCQQFGHASEICGFSPKCVKCAGDHHTKDCKTLGKITPKCTNCKGPHPANYRGCPKTPQLNHKKPHIHTQEKKKSLLSRTPRY